MEDIHATTRKKPLKRWFLTRLDFSRKEEERKRKKREKRRKVSHRYSSERSNITKRSRENCVQKLQIDARYNWSRKFFQDPDGW